MEDLYEILGVPRDASQADIKKAYRSLVKQFHPDAHPGDKDIEEKFKRINAAYTVLGDPEKRARYDQFGTTGPNADPFSGGFAGGGFTTVDLGDLFGDVFSQMFGGGFGGNSRRNSSAPRRGRDEEQIIHVTLLEAYTGTTRDIEFTRAEECQHCSGTGAKPGTKPETCTRCHGSGQVRETRKSGFMQFESVRACPDCNGTGKFIKDKCDECGGTGRIRKKQTHSMKIHPGVFSGHQYVIQGAGGEGYNGGPAGDLYLTIDVEPNKRFEREGDNLHTVITINYPQAVLGTEAQIEGVDGSPEKFTIPAGTQHGQVLKLKGRGMPHLKSSYKGDLHVHVYIDIPKELTDKQKELIKALADEMGTPINDNLFSKFKGMFK